MSNLDDWNVFPCTISRFDVAFSVVAFTVFIYKM